MKPAAALNLARGVFGTIIAILALTTFILLGANMDAVNFPGSNMKLAEYPEGHDKEGQYVKVLDGYKLDLNIGCSNFVNGSNGLNNIHDICKAATDDAADNRVEEWNSGWVVAPDCDRTKDQNVCAPFGSANALSVLGQITFALLAIQVILYAAHTGVAVVAQEKELSLIEEKKERKLNKMKDQEAARLMEREDAKSGKSTFRLLLAAKTTTKITIGLTVAWCLVGVALFAASSVGWSDLCDKIDTGLGRRIAGDSDSATYANATPACAGTGCTMSFGGLFATFVFAFVWYRIPDIVQWFGLLEAI